MFDPEKVQKNMLADFFAAQEFADSVGDDPYYLAAIVALQTGQSCWGSDPELNLEIFELWNVIFVDSPPRIM